MIIDTLDHIIDDPTALITALLDEQIIVYPTDTIYGIGGIITPSVIQQINTAKQRPSSKHYSIIAPSIDWIIQHMDVASDFAQQRTAYQQQFANRGLTLLLSPHEASPIPFNLLSSNQLIGIRLIDHPFQSIVEQLGQPLITTSANISGQPPIHMLTDLTPSQTEHISYAIDDGLLDAPASVIIHHTEGRIIRS